MISSFSPYKSLVNYNKLRNPTKGYPITITIDFTNHCNSNCDFCLNSRQRKQHNTEIPIQKIKDIFELCKNIGIKGIKIAGGGEPFMHTKILEILELMTHYDIDYAFTTNGTLITPKITQALTKIQTLKYISVSLESFNSDIYYKIRKYNITEQFTKNLEYLNKHKTFKTNIGLLIHNDAYKDIYNTCKKAKDLNFDSVFIKPLAFNDDFNTEYNIDFKILEECVQKSQKLNSRDFKVKVSSSRTNKYLNSNIDYKSCQAVYIGGVFGGDGKFHICCDRRNDNLCLFDFFKNEVKDFTKYWNSKEHHDLVNSINPSQDCPRCTYNAYNKIIKNLKDDIFENLI